MSCGSCLFSTMNMTNVDENTQNPPFLHVKRENTHMHIYRNSLNRHNNGRKYTFSQIGKILRTYPRLDECISFPFVPGSRTGFKRICGHTYYILKSVLLPNEMKKRIDFIFLTIFTIFLCDCVHTGFRMLLL